METSSKAPVLREISLISSSFSLNRFYLMELCVLNEKRQIRHVNQYSADQGIAVFKDNSIIFFEINVILSHAYFGDRMFGQSSYNFF